MQVFAVLDSTMRSPGAWFWNFLKSSGLLERFGIQSRCFPSFYLIVLLWK